MCTGSESEHHFFIHDFIPSYPNIDMDKSMIFIFIDRILLDQSTYSSSLEKSSFSSLNLLFIGSSSLVVWAWCIFLVWLVVEGAFVSQTVYGVVSFFIISVASSIGRISTQFIFSCVMMVLPSIVMMVLLISIISSGVNCESLIFSSPIFSSLVMS